MAWLVRVALMLLLATCSRAGLVAFNGEQTETGINEDPEVYLVEVPSDP